jgi:hypothetical protein
MTEMGGGGSNMYRFFLIELVSSAKSKCLPVMSAFKFATSPASSCGTSETSTSPSSSPLILWSELEEKKGAVGDGEAGIKFDGIFECLPFCGVKPGDAGPGGVNLELLLLSLPPMGILFPPAETSSVLILIEGLRREE